MDNDIDRATFAQMFGKDAIPEPSEMPEYCEHVENHDECTCDPDDEECDVECPVCSDRENNPILNAFLYCLSRAEHILDEHSDNMSPENQVKFWLELATQHRRMLTD